MCICEFLSLTLLLWSTSGKLVIRAQQVKEFQPPDAVKSYFTCPFKRFIQEQEGAMRRRLFT